MSVNVPFHVGGFLAGVHMQLSVFSPDGEWQEIPPSSCLPPLLPRKAAPWLVSPQSNLKCRCAQMQIYAFDLFLILRFVPELGVKKCLPQSCISKRERSRFC